MKVKSIKVDVFQEHQVLLKFEQYSNTFIFMCFILKRLCHKILYCDWRIGWNVKEILKKGVTFLGIGEIVNQIISSKLWVNIHGALHFVIGLLKSWKYNFIFIMPFKNFCFSCRGTCNVCAQYRQRNG